MDSNGGIQQIYTTVAAVPASAIYAPAVTRSYIGTEQANVCFVDSEILRHIDCRRRRNRYARDQRLTSGMVRSDEHQSFTALTGIDEVRATSASRLFNVEAPLFAGITKVRFRRHGGDACPGIWILHRTAALPSTSPTRSWWVSCEIQLAIDNQVLTFNDKATALLVNGEWISGRAGHPDGRHL